MVVVWWIGWIYTQRRGEREKRQVKGKQTGETG